MSQQHILVTGGSGYIGSHTTIQLLDAGYKVTVIDSLVNSNVKSLERVREIVGDEKAGNLNFIKVDMVDKPALAMALSTCGNIDACIHFAGLKAVGESVQKPLLYFHNNLTSTFFLLELMKSNGCKKIVFSSSATVYGTSSPPLTESRETECVRRRLRHTRRNGRPGLHPRSRLGRWSPGCIEEIGQDTSGLLHL